MLDFLETLKSKLEPQEEQAFIRRITSLNSNIVYWNKQLTTNQTEAQTEINRCKSLLAIVMKDLKKVEARN